MRISRQAMLASAGVGLVVFGLVIVPHMPAGANAARTTYLTFTRAVRVPGATLDPGTYIFELADPLDAPGVVRVLSQDRRHPYFMGFTNTTERPRGLRVDASVSLGESAGGVAPPITAWWPIGERTGREFVFPDR